jgi:hypothetical protein
MFRESQLNRNPIGANKKQLVATHGEEPSVKKVGTTGRLLNFLSPVSGAGKQG